MNYKPILLLVVMVFMTTLISAQETVVGPNTAITIEAGATLDFVNSDLILRSDASGDASLIDKGTVMYSGSGETKVERYLSEGKWHLLSSPVSNAQAGMFTGDYLQYHTESTNGWTDITPVDYDLSIMQAYSIWSVNAGPSTEVFTGTTNTGSHSKAFTQSGDGWNLIGNPYPSALDWDAVAIPPELNGAIWVFDPTIGTNGDYVYYINGGGGANTATQYIPSGQGFFVRATGGSGTITFDNDDRIHNGQAFYKDSQNNLLVIKATGNNITTQTAIRFNEDATQEVDRLFDVYRIISDSPEVPMLFTVSESHKMAINTLPSIKGNEIVPMWFRAGVDGKYTIKAAEIETFENETPIYLYDLEADYFHNLRDLGEYKFDYQSGEDRNFEVYFTEIESTEIVNDMKIFAQGNVLNVNFPDSYSSNPDFYAKIMVYDISGKLVIQATTKDANNTFTIDRSSSIYMVNILTGNKVLNEKIYIQ
jgi:hypothetical protein